MNAKPVVAVLLLTLGTAVAQQPAAATPLQQREQILHDRVAAQQLSVQATSAAQEQPKVSPRPALHPDTDSRRFVFTLTEFDHDKKVNSRSFEMLSRDRENSNLNTGSRVPIVSANSKDKDIQYIDIGLVVNIEYSLRQDGRLDIAVVLNLSNIASPAGESQSFTPPIIRQTHSAINAVIVPDTPTILNHIEDPNSGHAYELSVIAKPR